jgi:hypothetical protein
MVNTFARLASQAENQSLLTRSPNGIRGELCPQDAAPVDLDGGHNTVTPWLRAVRAVFAR